MAINYRKPEDELLGLGGSAGSAGSGGSAAPGSAPGAIAPQAPKYVNLQQYIAANQGAGNQIADKAFGGIQAEAQKYASLTNPAAVNKSLPGNRITTGPGKPTINSDADADKLTQAANAAGRNASLAGTWGGRQTQLENTYGKDSSYTQGEKDLDNALMGNAASGRLNSLSNIYSGLSNYMAKYTPPPVPTPPPAPVAPPVDYKEKARKAVQNYTKIMPKKILPNRPVT